MNDITEQPDPATNSRFTKLANGSYSELIATNVQLFYDPVTMNSRVMFNSLPFVDLGGYMPLGNQMDNLQVDFSNRMMDKFVLGVNPLTGNDLSNIMVADMMVLLKCAFDTLHNERAAQIAADNAAAEAAAAAAAAAAAEASSTDAAPAA